MRKTLESLAFVALLGLVANFVSNGTSPMAALPGILVLAALALSGKLLALGVARKGIPDIVYISLLGLLVTAPFCPLAPLILPLLERVDFLALTTPVLACAGVGLGAELPRLRSQGLKLLLVSLLVFTGTFLGAAVLAEMVQRLLGS